MRTSFLIIAVATAAGFASGPQALNAAPSVTRIALAGQAAPGLEGVRFSSILMRSINASGDFAFSAHLTGDGIVAGVNDDALFLYHASTQTFSLIAREGDSARGLPASTIYRNLPSNDYTSTLLLDNTGHVAFGARLYDNITGSTSKALFYGSAISPTFVASTEVIPNDPYEDRLTPFLHPSGQFLYLREIISFPPHTKTGGWLKLTPTGPQYVLRMGDPAPMPSLSLQRQFADLMFLTSNSAGQILLQDDLFIPNSPYRQPSLWTGTIESPTLVASGGDVIPDFFRPDARYDYFSSSQINNTGQIALAAATNGPSIGTAIPTALLTGTPQDLRVIAATTLPAPGVPDGVVYLAAGSPRLNDAGKLFFRALLSGSGVSNSNDDALYIVQPGESSAQLLARAGDPVPGTEAGTVYESFGLTGLNNRGIAVFSAMLSGPDVTDFNERSLWFEYDGLPRLLLRTGQELEVAGNDVRTLRSFLWSAENGNDGAGMGFNDNNQVSIQAYFTDGSYGIFLLTVPEPAPIALFGIGLLTLLLWRSRGRLPFLAMLSLCSTPLFAEAPLFYDPTPDFIAYNPDYRKLKRDARQHLHALQADLISQQKAGRKTHCARQVMLEAKWYVYYTAHFDKTTERLQTLRAILNAPKDPHDGSQLDSDGSFGCCSTLWWKKLDITTDKLIAMSMSWEEPAHPVKLLEQINSPEKLTAYLDSILISDVSKTGVDHRYEHNSALSSLTRYICWEGTWKELPIKFKLHPQLRKTLLDYQDNKLQDPHTGYWGAWYRTRDGNIIKTADLSHTFHLAHFRHGDVQRWPQIIATTLAIKDREYPTGWLEDGKMTNHHNYDVALLLHMGFEHATPEQKKQIAQQVERMLYFCLKETLLPDGSFTTDDEDTLGAAFYFGVAFLHEIGYFSKPNRFWTDQDFPEASATNDRISARIRALKLDDPESIFALRLLAANKIAAAGEPKAAGEQLLDAEKQAATRNEPAYRVDRSFPQLPAEIKLAEVSGVAINSRGEIHIFHRGTPPIIAFDKSGKCLRSFGEGIKSSHGLRIDGDDNVWATDIVTHTVTKYSPDGKVLLVLGEKEVAGVDEKHFDKPTDIAFAPDGDIFVSDGYGNSRVVKFDKTGNFLLAWGKKGTGDGEFNTPHAIRLDSKGNVYVGDRENDRVQVFDQNGKHLRTFGRFAPFGLFITPDDHLFAADGRAHRAFKMTLDGKILDTWGRLGPQPGNFSLPHGIAVDKDGAIYITEITGKRIQKFVPQK